MEKLNEIESVLDRVANLDKLVIRHSRLLLALNGIENCIIKTQRYRESMNCILVADGGMGKSTVCREILSRMKAYEVKDGASEKTIIPAFYAEIPSPATIKSVATSLLRKLNDPNPSVGNTESMTTRLCLLLRVCETKIILLDEFHHLMDINNRSTRLNLKVCNWIKNLVNRVRVTFCLIGLPEFEPILRSDSQLARRFPLRYFLSPLPVVANNLGSLSAFLEEVETYCKSKLKLSAMPNLASRLMVYQMDAATSGNPAFIMSLIKETLIIALKNGGNSVTIEDFALAWDSGITFTASRVEENPFRMTMNILANNLKVKK